MLHSNYNECGLLSIAFSFVATKISTLTLGTDTVIPLLISVTGMGVMGQAWSEDKQVVFM